MTRRAPSRFALALAVALPMLSPRGAVAQGGPSPAPTAAPRAQVGGAPAAAVDPAVAQPTVDAQSVQAACGDGHFRLDGASAGADDASNFNAAWAPELDRIAACGRLLALTTSCLEIRGHYDAVEFKGAEAIVGGMAQAQRLRAESRASRIAEELRKRGVAESVPRHQLAPLDFPTFRGVTIDLRPHCREGVVQEYAEAIAEELRRDDAAPVASGDVPAPVEAVDESPQKVNVPVASSAGAARRTLVLALFATPALRGTLFPAANSGVTALSGDLDVGALMRGGRGYGTVRAGLGIGAPGEDRFAWFVAASGGYRASPRLALGLLGSYRVQTSEVGGPPLDKSWGIALEGLHELITLGPIVLSLWEAAGVSLRARRGELEAGEIRRTYKVNDTGLELSAGARFAWGVVP